MDRGWFVGRERLNHVCRKRDLEPVEWLKAPKRRDGFGSKPQRSGEEIIS